MLLGGEIVRKTKQQKKSNNKNNQIYISRLHLKQKIRKKTKRPQKQQHQLQYKLKQN